MTEGLVACNRVEDIDIERIGRYEDTVEMKRKGLVECSSALNKTSLSKTRQAKSSQAKSS